MTRFGSVFAASLAALVTASNALAGASDWYDFEGGSIRLVTSSEVNQDGSLQGALEIRLEPGWKTYWMDPGSSGVPPTLNVTADGRPIATDIAFPPPQRFDDGYGPWSGYDQSMALALTFHLPEAVEEPQILQASAFLGVCETICIPVQANLIVEQKAMDTTSDDIIVAEAFNALPAPARPGFEATLESASQGKLELDISIPENAQTLDIHVAGDARYAFGSPVRRIEGGRTSFSLPVSGSSIPPAGTQFPYTLVTSSGCVSGVIQLP